MRVNRRSVLFVLGTTVLLGGMLIASGAFSQVEASRDVSVETTGDGSAALGLALNSTVEDNYVNNTGGETLTLDFNDLNNDSVIYYDNLINVTNNGGQEVTVNATSSGSAIMVYDGTTRTFNTANGGANIGTIASNGSETKSFGVAVNTTAYNSGGDNTITITAST